MRQAQFSLRQYEKKIIKLGFWLESINPANYQITILNAIGAENFGQEKKVSYGNTDGKSAGSALYLAFLSALHKRPISRAVAAAGRIAGGTKKDQTVTKTEIVLPTGTNLPVSGLKAKITGAVEKGINRLVLSKYQCSPNLLALISKNKYYDDAGRFHCDETRDLKDDYQQVVPADIKAQIKEVHWAENMAELRNLFLQNQLD